MLGVKFRRGFRRSLIPGAEPAASPQGWDGFFGFFQGVFPWEKKKKKATPHSCLNPIWNPPAPGAAKVGGKQEKTGKKKIEGGKKIQKISFPHCQSSRLLQLQTFPNFLLENAPGCLGFLWDWRFFGIFFFFPFSAGGSFQGSRGRAAFPGIIGSMCGWRDGCGAAALERDVGKIPGAENSREIPP